MTAEIEQRDPIDVLQKFLDVYFGSGWHCQECGFGQRGEREALEMLLVEVRRSRESDDD